MNDTMTTEQINPERVKLYEKNVKYHPKAQVAQIAESIKRFGFRQPVVLDGDGVVVIGHGRVLAARQLGMSSIPCVRVDGLTDEQVKALRIADNKLNESRWLERQLKFELLELSPAIDLSGFGFEMPETFIPTDESDIAGEDDEVLPTVGGQGAYEYSGDEFGDERFECQCPECGFRFNP